MKLRGRSWAANLALLLVVSGCNNQPAKVPVVGGASASAVFAAAFATEMTQPDSADGYLDAIDRAVADPSATDSLAVVTASLDALLAGRGGRAPAPVSDRQADNYRKIAQRLTQAWNALDGSKGEFAPLIRSSLASSLENMALFTGETASAQAWRAREGCLAEATVVGPLDITPLTTLEQPAKTPATGPLPMYTGPNRFNPAKVAKIPAQGCWIASHGASDKPGTREIVIHLENPRTQALSFMMTATSTTVLEVGGSKVASREWDAGYSSVTTMSIAEASAGTLRVVIRVADKNDSSGVALLVVGDDGLPLVSKAPQKGDSADATVSTVKMIDLGAIGSSEDAIVTGASALLSAGNDRKAEHMLEAALLEKREGRSAAFHLLWMRAMERAADMADWKRVERERISIDEVKKAAPSSWELAMVESEMLTRRKGYSDGTFEALAALGVTKPDADLSKLDTMKLALVYDLSQRAGLDDLTERTYRALEKAAPGSSMLASWDAGLHPRSGRERVTLSCEGGLSRSTLSCAEAKSAIGDRKGALEEVARVRELTGSPRAYLDYEMSLRERLGDDEGALRVYESMFPWERSAARVVSVLARMKDRGAAKALAQRELISDQNRPYSTTTVSLAFGEPSEDAKRFEDEGHKLIERDRAQPILPGAATAVLKHVEHYGMDEDGFIHVVLYDLRRVAGTTDVDRSIWVDQPSVDGQGYLQLLRRRVIKKDGSILEAVAGGGDLSQLEQGDYIEHYLEGYYYPNEIGEVGLDTPDLMPERVSVADAEIVLRLPETFQATSWVHPLLGKPTEEHREGYKFVTYKLTNQAPREIEPGLSYIEAGVRVSLGTQTWEKVGKSITESIRSLEENDPFIQRFAEEASKGGDPNGTRPTDEAALVARVVEYVGKTIKIASGGFELSDYGGFAVAGGHGQSIRSMVEEGIGSRTWIIYRTLKELGVKVDLAVAETEPFSAAPNVPPHPGRFRKPLVVVRLASGNVWIDPDVDGPPPPPGRISAELKGRSAIMSSGEIVPVPVVDEDSADEADVQLAVDAAGTATGTVTLLLRGRTAQYLSESFNYAVGDDRRSMLRDVVSSWLPWASVDNVKLLSEDGSWEVKISASITIPGFGAIETKDGKTWILPGYDPAKSGTLAGMYASQANRTSALTIEWPIQYKLKRRITLPAGATVEKSAAAVDKKSDFVAAKRDIAVQGNTITETFTMNLPTGTVAGEDYDRFLNEVQAIDRGFETSIRVRVKQ
ncbi:MAG: hypothetical protein U0271_24450 [Polyangiaceae bacterium]